VTPRIRWGDKSEEEVLSNYIEYLDADTKPAALARSK
jgi:hypothetical protein